MTLPPSLQPFHNPGTIGGQRQRQKGRVVSMLAEQRRTVVAEKYLKCIPVGVIAKELGVSYRTIFDDLAIIRAEWRKRAQDDWLTLVATESEKLDRIEKEAWEAWNKSKDRLVMRVKEEREGPGRPSKASSEKQWEFADPTFLKLVLDCSESRRKLFGLDAPKRVDVSGVIQHKMPFTREEARDAVLAIFKRSERPAREVEVKNLIHESNPGGDESIEADYAYHLDDEQGENEIGPVANDDPWAEEDQESGGQAEQIGGFEQVPSSDDDWDL